jgi:drug/metabolite transporter (DMT)-like permease
VIVLGISIFWYGKVVAPMRKFAVIPIVMGVVLTFYGDVSFTATGAFYTLLCVLLAAMKSVAAGELLTGDLKLHEIDLLSKMAPLALIQIGSVALLTGEVGEIISRWDELSVTAAPQVVLLSGLLSFTLNVSSFIANKVTSALTLSIAANVKQVLIVTFATAYFGDTIGILNGVGIATVIGGSFLYGYISILHKN